MSEPTRHVWATDRPGPPPEPNTTPTLRAAGPGTGGPPAGAVTWPADPPLVRPAAPLPAGFPGYEILGEIGRGGMGVVYKARQRSLNRLVALKVILGGPHAGPTDRARLRVEAEAVARLRHPNIVQVHDVGDHDGFAYIALELIEGETLRAWHGGAPADPREAARLVATVARAVHHAHEQGIVHRDLKPANILLSSAERGARNAEREDPAATADPAPRSALRAPRSALEPKVTDFGLAKAMVGGADLTITGMACGTPNYMAPEQVRGGPAALTPAVDVYGLGAVLYELLTGRPPVTGTDPCTVMDRIIRSDPAPARRGNPNVPRDLDVIAARCLEKDPRRRYPSAAAVADDLDNFLAGRPIHARPVSGWERTWRWCRRNPVAAVLVTAACFGCGITGGLALALAKSVVVEQAARADAERSGRDADNGRREAEQTRDRLRDALAKTDAALLTAEAAKAAADRERKHAVESYRLTRSVIRKTIDQFADQPGLRGPEFRAFRAGLLATAAEYVPRLGAQAGDDVDRLSDLAELTHWMGYLAYLNGDMPAAAAHYRASAAACCRWAAADPDDPEARARMGSALTNAGNALFHAGRLADAEARHRDAVGVLDALADARPQVEPYAAQATRAYAPLYEILRKQGRWADARDVCESYLRRARELVRRHGEKPDHLVALADAHQCLGQMLARAGDPDAGECHLGEAIALRDRLGAARGWPAPLAAAAARTRAALAENHVVTNRPARALPVLAAAARDADQACEKDPQNPAWAADRAGIAADHGELLRRVRQFAAAEPHLDRAVARAADALGRPAPPAVAHDLRAVGTRAAVSRAHLYNHTDRHREAAVEWDRLSREDPNPAARPVHALFVLQSLAFARDWRAAAAGAARMGDGDPPPATCVELARVWCRVSRVAADDLSLDPAERQAEAEAAIGHAVRLLGRARAAGFFGSPQNVREYETHPDFAPVRGRFAARN